MPKELRNYERTVLNNPGNSYKPDYKPGRCHSPCLYINKKTVLSYKTKRSITSDFTTVYIKKVNQKGLQQIYDNFTTYKRNHYKLFYFPNVPHKTSCLLPTQ